MSDPFLVNVTTHESNGTYWCSLQRWVRQAVVNAGIFIPMSDPLLTNINLGDSEGTKFAKLQRWLRLLAENITGGGGGGVTAILAGSGISVDQPTGIVTVTATGGSGGGNAYATATNNSGNTTVTPTQPNYALGLTIGGSARSSSIILDVTGRTGGDKISLDLTLPATPSIVLTVRNATAGGTQLLPPETFPSNQFTTDGLVLSAKWEFVYTGAAWRYEASITPA